MVNNKDIPQGKALTNLTEHEAHQAEHFSAESHGQVAKVSRFEAPFGASGKAGRGTSEKIKEIEGFDPLIR